MMEGVPPSRLSHTGRHRIDEAAERRPAVRRPRHESRCALDRFDLRNLYLRRHRAMFTPFRRPFTGKLHDRANHLSASRRRDAALRWAAGPASRRWRPDRCSRSSPLPMPAITAAIPTRCPARFGPRSSLPRPCPPAPIRRSTSISRSVAYRKSSSSPRCP